MCHNLANGYCQETKKLTAKRQIIIMIDKNKYSQNWLAYIAPARTSTIHIVRPKAISVLSLTSYTFLKQAQCYNYLK